MTDRHALTVRWSLADAPSGVEEKLREYVAGSSLARFTEVMPSDFKRVLEAREEALEDGLSEDEAAARIMEVLHG